MEDEQPEMKSHDGESLRQQGAVWMDRIRNAEKRERDWAKAAKAAERAYSADPSMDSGSGTLYDYNILHSNVETIVPAIFNSTPVPDIRPRRKESMGAEPQPPQEEGDEQALMQFERARQEYQQRKQADKDTKAYADMLERAIAVQIDDNKLDTEIESLAQDSFLSGRGIIRIRYDYDGEEDEVTGERTPFEAVSWRDYREGPAKRWDDVPWIAYRVPMERETYERVKNKDMMSAQVEATDERDEDSKNEIVAWEVWDKLKGEVIFVREDKERIMSKVPDPLSLPGFFPQPEPVQPITLTGKRIPVCPFSVYRKLADELDLITKRINKIVSGIKVRGMVAGNAESLVRLSEADDNEIVVEHNLEQLVQTGGLDRSIAWWPVDVAASVLRELYVQREQVKSSIYEITGISDIVRGASNSAETATAQQIKTQWGSLRIQKMQRLIERQVRDIFVLMSHIISTKFSPQTLQRMTGIEITEGMMQLMQSPIDSDYRVDVESDSTVRADLTRQKEDMANFMGATAQFFSAVAPLVQQSPEAAEPFAEIYSASSRLFKLGKSAEDALERFVDLAKQAATNPPPNPEAEKAKAEQAMKEREMESKAQQEGVKLQIDEQKLALEKEKLMIDQGRLDLEARNSDRDYSLRKSESGAVENENGDIQSREDIANKALLESIAVLAESLSNGDAAIMAGLERMAATLSAPKQTELVLDDQGQPIGAVQRPMVN